tara:strand:- start:202 stop:624 length:423 start_codon:yes stop_codon:yes gene_type:complete
MSSFKAAEKDLALAKKDASLRDKRLMIKDAELATSLGRMALSGPSNKLIYKAQFRPSPRVAKIESQRQRLAHVSDFNKKREQAKMTSILNLITKKRLPIRAKSTIGRFIGNNSLISSKKSHAGKKKRTYKRKQSKRLKKS